MISFFWIALLASAATWYSLRLITNRERAAAVARITELFEPPHKRKSEGAKKSLIETAPGDRGPLAIQLLERLRLKERVERLMDTSDVKWGAAGLAHRCTGAVLLGFAIVFAFAGQEHLGKALLAAAAAGYVPVLYVQKKARARIVRFEAQFPDCLQFISRSMRAGHAFSVALGLVHKEFEDPLGTEFRRIFEEQNLGQSLDLVLQRLAVRIPSMDVQFFVSAVTLHKKTGGNLAELLDKLSTTMRDRFKLRGHIRTLSAQGLMSGRVLSAIPVIVAGFMFMVNREYVLFFLHDPAGNTMLTICIGMQVVGYLIIKKLVNVEV